MNAPFPVVAIAAVRTADMGDVRDVRAIEAFLSGREQASPFHRPAWIRAVEAGTGARAHFLIAEREGALAGLLPLSHLRSRLFGSALVSCGFAVDGGIVAEDEASASALADAAIALADRLGCPGVELRGGALPPAWERSEGIYAGFSRDLPEGEEAILKSIPRKQRAEVRRAMSFGLETCIHRDCALHHRIYAESVRNLGTPVFPRRLFEAVLDAFGEDADILTVFRDGRPLASVLSLYSQGAVYPYWGGGTFEARAARANELLYFALMRHASARGCARFDFGRSKLGTGAFAFKKNWGFEPRPLAYAVWGKERATNPLSPRYRLKVALWKKLPLWAANRIGPILSRGLG